MQVSDGLPSPLVTRTLGLRAGPGTYQAGRRLLLQLLHHLLVLPLALVLLVQVLEPLELPCLERESVSAPTWLGALPLASASAARSRPGCTQSSHL